MSTLGRWLEGWLMPRVYRHVPTYAVSRSTAEEMRRELGWRTSHRDPRERVVVRGARERSGPGRPPTRPGARPPRAAQAGRRGGPRGRRAPATELPGLHLDVVGRGPDRDAVLAGDRRPRTRGPASPLHGYLSDDEMDRVARRLRAARVRLRRRGVGAGRHRRRRARHPHDRPRRARPARLDRRRQHGVAGPRPARATTCPAVLAEQVRAGDHGAVRPGAAGGVRRAVPGLGGAILVGADAPRSGRRPPSPPAPGDGYR